MSTRFIKTVHLVVQGDVFKTLYFDWERERLRANVVFVHDDGSVFFEVNSEGLKGDPIDNARKLVVTWGDSVVFGVGYSWPRLMDAMAPGHQFLNGGIEGDGFSNILRRASEFNRGHKVALNVVMLGWHPHPIFTFDAGGQPRNRWGPLGRLLERRRLVDQPNQGLREGLTEFLREFPNSVVVTMPTALHEGLVGQDLTPFFTDGDDDTGFNFMGRIPYAVANQRALWDFVRARNGIAKEVCRGLGIRVIDLFEEFNTQDASDFRDAFRDILHFRVRAYPRVAQVVHTGIKDLLA